MAMVKRYFCVDCCRSYVNLDHFERYNRRRIHHAKPLPIWECTACDTYYKTEKNASKHNCKVENKLLAEFNRKASYIAINEGEGYYECQGLKASDTRDLFVKWVKEVKHITI